MLLHGFGMRSIRARRFSVSASAVIGSTSVIQQGAVIGSGVVIGERCVIGHNVVLQNTVVGNDVVIHPGTCIGQDGFGFEIGLNQHKKKPQMLQVVIQDKVELGANCTIDRGSWRDTVIGEGTKVDNLVQIAHNVQIGKHCLIAAQTGIAGSTNVGDFCLIGGQVGIAQHLNIGFGVHIAAKSGVMHDLNDKTKYGGVPAVELRQFHKQTLKLRQLANDKNS